MLSDEQLAELEGLAGTFMGTDSLELIMELPRGFLQEAIAERSPEGLAVLRGRLKTEARIRKGVIDLAIAGSGPAQAMAKDFIEEMRMCDI